MSLIDDLTQIGFTEYEARVYIALLRDHPATGYQLSKESGVPRSMVYEALGRLHARGAALETVEGRATLYRPIAPNQLIAAHEAEHQRLVGSLQVGLNALYSAEVDDRVWTISGPTAVLGYARQLLAGAQSEAHLVLTDEDLNALRPELAAADGRGVAIHTLLTGQGVLRVGRVAYHPPLESELQGLTTTLLIVVDDRETLIAGTTPHHATTATVTRSRDLVMIARQFVWMELLTQRLAGRLGRDLLARLDPEDRAIFASLSDQETHA